MSNDPITDFGEYRKFLETIPLAKYREELKVKWVEQDLHPLLYPLASIYENYWDKREFLSFEDWFAKFWDELNKEQKKAQKLGDFKEFVRVYRKFYDDKINGDHEKRFSLGFKARMYRTWVSVLTQLDFCYIIEYICSREGRNLALESNAELDAKGIDVKINNIQFQIKKISKRKEALRLGGGRKITIPYTVFDLEEFQRLSKSSRVKDKMGYQKALDSFYKYFIRLPNGFIVFKEDYIRPIIENISSIGEVKKVVKIISLELSGEEDPNS